MRRPVSGLVPMWLVIRLATASALISMPMPLPCTPVSLAISVKSRTPLRASSAMRFRGAPQVRKPPIITVLPSLTFATASGTDKISGMFSLPFCTMLCFQRQSQDLPGFIGAGHFPPQFPREAHDPGHQLPCARGQLPLAVVDVVLKAHPHMSAHGDGHRGQGRLKAPYPRYCPGGTRGQSIHQENQIAHGARHGTRDSQNEVEMERLLHEALLHQAQ